MENKQTSGCALVDQTVHQLSLGTLEDRTGDLAAAQSNHKSNYNYNAIGLFGIIKLPKCYCCCCTPKWSKISFTAVIKRCVAIIAFVELDLK